MLAPNKTLALSWKLLGTRTTTTTQRCRWTMQYLSRQFCVSATFSSSSGPSSIDSIVTPDKKDSTEGKVEDAFSDPNVMKEAKERWGWGVIDFAPIVFPEGRPEIAEQTKKMTRARITSGHIGQRIPKDVQNSLRDQQAQAVMDPQSRSRFSRISSSLNPHLHRPPREEMPQWMKHKLTIKEKLLNKAWNPKRKLTRQAMDEVRFLHKQFPDEWTTPKLASHFNVASESIVRILSSKFQPPSARVTEQDEVKTLQRKANVMKALEQQKTERHAEWLKRKAEQDKNKPKSAAPVARIKLGAPKRSIG